MNKKFTAVYRKSGKWYLGWVEEIPGVNTQGRTLKEARENLKEALSLVIETNRMILKKDFISDVEREKCKSKAFTFPSRGANIG